MSGWTQHTDVRWPHMHFYEMDNGRWTVADEGGWIPGAFDSLQTAALGASVAIGVHAAAYAEMQKRINYVSEGNRLITQDDIYLLTSEARQ